MENTDHHSLVVANATAVHGNRNAVLLTLVPLAPLHYTVANRNLHEEE
jgi:hypothetical protein